MAVRGHHITATHNGGPALVAEDPTYSAGQVGLRVVNTHAIFSGFRIANNFVSAPP